MNAARLGLTITILLVAAFADARTPGSSFASAPRDHVVLQLKWIAQAQFAGYYAAQAMGYYATAGLDVDIRPGSAEVAPEPVVASEQAEFGIDWLPSLLVAREQGMDLVNIAQVFQRSATTELTWKASGISSFDGLRGRDVAVWCCGNQYELYAALRKAGIDPLDSQDVRLIDQPSDMGLFLSHDVDAAAAETYNELAQVLETTDPSTGQLYTADDLTVLSMEDAGTAMLQDGVFVSSGWLAEPGHEDIARRFLQASDQGWLYCRDHADVCVALVLARGTSLGMGHQRWMLNEINDLIWPSPGGIGLMDEPAYQRTVSIALEFGDITEPPSGTAYRTDLARQALSGVIGDPQGLGWKKAPVPVTPGGT
jgi:NitT/TauT family transport system substrate-binding protein